ncbi:MAG: hypothetical protein ACOYNL_04030 [Rickettsiales bacterium]
MSDVASDAVSDTFYGAWDVVQTPFEDIGLKRKPIPDQLKSIVANPYAVPKDMSCEALRKEIIELDTLVGPDVCTTENPTGAGKANQDGYLEQGVRMGRDQAVGMVGSKTNIIPFRGVVRRISGADKHAQAVERAYTAGKLRRAFLKGLVALLAPQCRSVPVENPYRDG